MDGIMDMMSAGAGANPYSAGLSAISGMGSAGPSSAGGDDSYRTGAITISGPVLNAGQSSRRMDGDTLLMVGGGGLAVLLIVLVALRK